MYGTARPFQTGDRTPNPEPRDRCRSGARPSEGAVVRVVVDRDVCAGTGLCERICPEVFTVEDGYSTVHPEGISDARRGSIEEAVRLCPLQALHIEEGE